MTSKGKVTLTRQEYEALIDRNTELEDALAAIDADDGVRVPHAIALEIIKGKSPILAYRNHLGLTLQGLSAKTGLAVSYLSEIERGRKAGSTAAMKAIASALGTTIDVLLID